MQVSEILIRWYDENKRDLPWRNSSSAYHIWLSEIILQQTRVVQGLEYYNRFVSRFPVIEDLASASSEEVLKLWQGLGYYTRARNLHKTAQTITNEFGGVFPSGYDALIKFKGIGKYTAAAIASMAFGEPVALVDGNVNRVLSRFYAADIPTDSSAGRNYYNDLAQKILDQKRPGMHNQALMEFGALVCTPRNPKCQGCVLAALCMANVRGIVDNLPAKKAKRVNRIRYFNYLFIQYNGYTYIKKRISKDIWHSLFEFPLIETNAPVGFQKLLALSSWDKVFDNEPVKPSGKPRAYKHMLTHQTLYCRFYLVKVNREPLLQPLYYMPVLLERLHEFAIPRAIDRYLRELQHNERL